MPIARPSREPNTKRRISSYWGILFGEVGRQSRDTPRKADTARDTKQNCWDAGQHKHNLLTGRRSVDHWSLRQSIVATFTWAKEEEEEEEGNCVPCPRESPPSTSRLATTKDNSLSLYVSAPSSPSLSPIKPYGSIQSFEQKKVKVLPYHFHSFTLYNFIICSLFRRFNALIIISAMRGNREFLPTFLRRGKREQVL